MNARRVVLIALLITLTALGGVKLVAGLATGERQSAEPRTVRDAVAGYRDRDCSWCPDMVLVPGGSFEMGSRARDEESPRRTVEVQAFEIGFEEVQLNQFKNAIGGEGLPSCRRAVCGVSWDDAMRYIEWLRLVTGRLYRLPSEAEWEYVAQRAAKCSASDCFVSNIVGENVWEWVEDCWHPNYKDAPSDGRAWIGDDSCEKRVVRAGRVLRAALPAREWRRPPIAFRLGLENGASGVGGERVIGFRVARSLEDWELDALKVSTR